MEPGSILSVCLPFALACVLVFTARWWWHWIGEKLARPPDPPLHPEMEARLQRELTRDLARAHAARVPSKVEASRLPERRPTVWDVLEDA